MCMVKPSPMARSVLPIVLIWTTVLVSLLRILSTTNIIGFGQTLFFWAQHVLFVMAFAGVIRVSRRMIERVKSGISGWDDETKNNLHIFLKIRFNRLLTSTLFAAVMFASQIYTFFSQNQASTHEIFSYLSLVVLFHVSLMSTLILGKLGKTIQWVEHENHLETLEKP